MSAEFHNSKQQGEVDGLETLRALAKLPAPEDLPDRVHARLRQQASAGQAGARRGFWAGTWGLWRPMQRLQFAGAAALALAVAGSTWGVYHARPGQNTAGQVPGPAPVQAPASGLSGAKAVRVPPTLKPILVSPVAHRKPGAGKAAAKPSPKTLAVSPAGPANP